MTWVFKFTLKGPATVDMTIGTTVDIIVFPCKLAGMSFTLKLGAKVPPGLESTQKLAYDTLFCLLAST